MKRFSGLALRIVFFGCRLIGFSRLTLLMSAGKVSVSEPLSNLYNQAPKDANENPLLRGEIIKESFECVQLLARNAFMSPGLFKPLLKTTEYLFDESL